MFLKDFLKHFAGFPDNYWVNVHSVDSLGRTFYIYTQEQFDESDEQIRSLKEDLEGEIQWRKELQKEAESLNKQLDEQERIIRKFDEDGVSVKELVAENEDLKKKINEWRNHSLDLEAKIEKLNKRKNKATIMRRDLTTGQLVAEYEGIEYILTKKS